MQKLTLPKTGQGMTEGTLVEWNVDVGGRIDEGDPVLHFETDKMVSEIAANQDGVLLEKRVEEGDTVAVGTLLGEEGEAPPSDDSDVSGEEDEKTAPADERAEMTPGDEREETTTAESTSDDEAGGAGSAGITRSTPAARRAAREAGVDVETVSAARETSRVTPEDVEAYLASNERDVEAVTQEGTEILGTPWARVVASDNDVTVEDVGEYLDVDRVRERHVREYLDSVSESTEETAHPVATEERAAPTVAEEVAISGGEKVMFDQMSHVAKNYASTTTAAKVDVTDLLDLYDDLKTTWVEEQDDELSLTAFVARAVAQTIPDFPRLNAEYVESEETLRLYDDVNLGIAVNSEDGLIVPTIYGCGSASVRELSRDIDAIARKVDDRRLEPGDLENATFSLSNAGSLGAYINTPQINPPQTAILGVCKIFDDAGVVDGEVVPRKYMHLCLTYDHRVVEGADAVQFLQRVKSALETPTSLLQ
ncbi:MAG: dihydrolipoamide acetyltransferase family protein [Halanaeroarchaeum sp.]